MPTTRSQDNAAENVAPVSDKPSSVRGASSASRPAATRSVRGASSASRPATGSDNGGRDAAAKSPASSRNASTTESESTERTTTSGSTERTTSSGTTSTENITENTTSTNVTVKPTEDTGRAMSMKTQISRSRKLKEAELKEKLAALKLEEVRASIALARAQYEKHQADAADEQDSASEEENEDEEKEERSSRVQEWLEVQPENENGRPEKANMERRGQDARSQDDGKCEHRGEKHRPARQPLNVDVTSLATALSQAVRTTRDAPRYLQELPIFNGQCGSWLTFRAAYEETEKLFSKTENVSRLRRSVKGAAHEAISSLLISSPDPSTIMEALQRRFGRPDALAIIEIQKIKSLGKLSENPRDLCIFANKVSNIIATLEALKKIQYMYNPELVKITIEKLTPILRKAWYDYAAKAKEDIPDLKSLAIFLNEEADKCGAYAQPEDVSAYGEKHMKKRTEHTYSMKEQRSEQCPVCKQHHQLPECKRFREVDTNERWEIVKKHRVCFQCLRSSHRRSTCKAKKCGRDGCNMAHHRLLHHQRRETAVTPPPSNPVVADVTSTVEIVKNTNSRSRQAYLKIAPVTLTGPTGARVDTYALMDDGSTITLIDENLAEILELDGPQDAMWVQGLNETVKHENSRRVDITIRGRFNNEEFTIRSARTVQRLMFTKQSVERRDLRDCAHLYEIEEKLTYKNASPKILIGQDNWELLLAQKTLTGRQDQPVASLTRLGWVLHGCRTSYHENVAFCGHTTLKEEDIKMESMMKNFFDLEAIGINPKRQKSDPEERALKTLKENSRRLPDGRFVTSLLWKQDNFVIPNNYENAFNRLKNLEKKLDRDPVLKGKYEERMENLLASGYAVAARTPARAGKTWYLPHFAVCNPLKPKIRLVHDAAARSHGWSLNDMLLSGPDLLQSLPGVVMRFRQHMYAISADIKEMFMQIKIREEDRDALRFLWRGENRGDARPEEYQMTSVIFGATSSPCTALYIKNRNSEDFEAAYPEAVKEIKKNHYMDDFISSFPTKEEAIQISKDVDYVHRKGGFVLRGWVSNDPSVSRHFDTDTGTETIPIGDTDTEKTLGLLWEVGKDCIGFRLNIEKTPPEVLNRTRPPTKREALSVIMSLFDPLGLVSPLTTPAKKLMQETWRYGTGWDEPIPENLQPRWTSWMNNLKKIEDLHIPRCYSADSPVVDRQLHVFVDASQEAYATAIFIRMKQADGSTRVTLAAAKSRVAPLKPTSIPRLELQAALLGARLAERTEEEHDFQFTRKIYWTDSRTVLAWIRSEPRTFKTFVAHRLAEIEELTKVNQWRWVPTKENVADDATRETPSDFNANHRWFHGPPFLKKGEEEWPCEEKIVPEKSGEEKCCAACEPALTTYLPNIENISRWQTLVRATARVLQFIDLCRCGKHVTAAVTRKRTKMNPKEDPSWKRGRKMEKKSKSNIKTLEKRKFRHLESEYILNAEKLWVRQVQTQAYESERERIIRGNAPGPRDKLASLSVYIGNDGLIRLRGRIRAIKEIDMETINPVLLEGNHKYTKMYIQYVHEKMHHGGVELIVNELRQRYWITRIRPTVKNVTRNCPLCKIRKAKPMTPSTGDLPLARLSHHARPFSFTGLDYFGPLVVTVGRRHEKRWVALFTCLTMRAIHLEVVTSLSADSAISALRRFIARRGVPTEIWSDNATSFKAANRELKDAAQDIIDATRGESSAHSIRWCNIPSAAPFMGGAWERLVRSVKTTLRVTLHAKYPSEETLCTLLAEAENIINSRPLTHVPVTPDEPEALTPNHILLGPNNHVPAPGHFTEGDESARKVWRRAQRLADEFWRRWVKEYLPQLQHRREPHHTGSHPRVGDLVLLCDPNLPRNVWPRGRVTRVYPGPDGEVRVVDITTSNGHVLRRPSKRIIVLPVKQSRAATAGEMCTIDSIYIK